MKPSRVIILGCLAALIAVGGCSKPPGQRELEKGLRELNRGNYVRAKVLLEKSVSARPGHIDNAMAHNFLGITAWRLGQLDAAASEFENARRLNPNLIEPIYNLGVLAGERDDLRTAARYLNEAATLAPEDPRPLEYLAELHAGRGQWAPARNALYSALDRSPRSARIQNAIAYVHASMDQPDEAQQALLYALEADRKFAPALFNLAVLYDTAEGDGDQARAYYKRFVSVDGRNPHADEARDALARIREQGPIAQPGDYEPGPDTGTDDAADVMLVVEDPVEDPADEPEELSLYDRKLREAETRALAGDVQGAIGLCREAALLAARDRDFDLEENALRQAVSIAIDQPLAHTLLGEALFRRGKYADAAQSFRQAMRLNENFAPAQLGMARTSERAGETDAAVVHYRKALESDPRLADALWELALIYDRELDAPDLAAEAYRTFAGRFPSDARRGDARARADELVPPPEDEPAERRQAGPLPRDEATVRRIAYTPPSSPDRAAALRAFKRASIYQEQREWDKAVFHYLRSLEQDDRMASVFYNLGICYSMDGDAALARDAYGRALKLDPDMADAQYNLALLHTGDGDDAGAVTILRDLVKKHPDYASAHYALGVIYSKEPREYERAKRHYRKYLELSPNDRSAQVIREWVDAH